MSATEAQTIIAETTEITDELMHALNAIEPGASESIAQTPIQIVQNLPTLYIDTFEMLFVNVGQFVFNVIAMI